MTKFQPIGTQARWKTIYEILKHAKTDSVIGYEALGEALGLDPAEDRHAIQMAMRRAAREYLERDSQVVDVVANEGYRVTRAVERMGITQRFGRKVGRDLARGYSTAHYIELSEINDPQVRRGLELTEQAFSIQMEFNRRFAVRQEQLERAVRDVADAQQTGQKRASEEVAELREEVTRLKRQVEGDES